MGEVDTCPKCGGELREGELFVSAVRRIDHLPMTMGGRDYFSALGSFQGGDVSVEGPFWREYTGEEKGWLWKRKEVKVLSVKGKRCISCGYIELYALTPVII